MKINITEIEPGAARTLPEAPFGFGRIFSNHMLVRTYKSDGWEEAKIQPYGPIQMELSMSALHYGQEIFEGTKAYRRPDGHINLFRIDQNIKRFNRSAERMQLPMMDEEEQLEAIATLIKLDSSWVPDTANTTLYIRPAMVSSEATIGSLTSNEALFFILLSPVDPYFANGFAPISVYVEDQYVRAVRGGVGEAKTGGNYAASMQATKKAIAAGYKQVVWLDAIERRYVEEMGGMNIFFVYGDKLVTSPLTGTILPGVTRDSLLTLGADLGYEVEERMIDIQALMADIKSGACTEAFACGTAAVIAPIGKMGYQGQDVTVNGNEVGRVTRHLYEELTGIQFGRIPDRFGWTLKIEK
ncbi:MAG: branched-chain amino acid aminotransferase [Chloroflexota bacterium]